MKIIAHRGYWLKTQEQNTITAFKRAVAAGFGVETDVRDFHGALVIAHDLPNACSIKATEAFKVFAQMGSNQTLAINVKSCGLQALVLEHVRRFKIKNYFIFDAAIPDGMAYIQTKIPFFTRQSEAEQDPHLLTQSQGVWLDGLKSDWFNMKLIQNHLNLGKKVCIVSSELHKRPYRRLWTMLTKIDQGRSAHRLSICTDLPEQARDFFLCRK